MTKIIIVANTGWYLFNFRRNLARFLRDQGFEVVLVSPRDEFVGRMKSMGFRWLPWEVGRKTLTPWREVGALIRLLKIYRSEQPALVHHHTIKPTLYGSLAGRFLGIRAIVNSITGRGYIFLGGHFKARALRRLIVLVYKLALRGDNCLAIFENQEDQQYFTRHQLISAGRTRLIESVGVDPDRFSPAPEPEGVPVILLASRMLWDKGVGILVEATRLLHRRVKVRVVLAGDPDPGNPASIPEATLRGWHAEGVIEWRGFQPDMPALYQGCHLVTLPSRYGEGVPTTLLEAAACARPIVTTDIPGCRDFVIEGVTGLVIPPDDPAALAQALERLVTDPVLRRRMGLAGRRRVEEKYTTAIVNQATLKVYQELLIGKAQ